MALSGFDEGIDHALLAGAVEIDGELVAVDGRDGSGAEFLVEHALAAGEAGLAADDAPGDQLALDGQRLAGRAVARVGVFAVRLGPLPARRAVGGVERLHRVEARGAVARHMPAP